MVALNKTLNALKPPVAPSLARCPFCGKTAGYVECIDIGLLGAIAEWAYICDCGARGPTIECEQGKDERAQRLARKAWNRRAQLPRACAEGVGEEDALGVVVERAARELPEGWVVRVCVEKDAGWVELWTPLGAELGESSADSLPAQVNNAIHAALATAAEQAEGGG